MKERIYDWKIKNKNKTIQQGRLLKNQQHCLENYYYMAGFVNVPIPNPELNSHIQCFYQYKIQLLKTKIEPLAMKNRYYNDREFAFFSQSQHIAEWYRIWKPEIEHMYQEWEYDHKRNISKFKDQLKKERVEFLQQCNYYDSVSYFLKRMGIKEHGYSESNLEVITGSLKIPTIDNVPKEDSSFCVLWCDFSKKKMKSKWKHTFDEKIKKIRDEMGLSDLSVDMSLNDWSKKVKDKYHNKCAICNSVKKIESHHLFYKAKYPLLAFSIKNGICLCKECHHEIHFPKKIKQKRLLQNKLLITRYSLIKPCV